MKAIEEINMMVKSAQAKAAPLESMKPINWFDEKYQNAMNGPAKPYDFRGEALKVLKPFRQRVGQHGADALAREFQRQWKDIQANPGKYDDSAKRSIIAQWKNRISEFDRQAKQTAKNVNLSNNRQVMVMPRGAYRGGSGWTGHQVSSGGVAPSDRVQSSGLNPTLNVAATKGGTRYYDIGGGKLVAQNDLPSMRMQQKWTTPYPNTPAGRNAYLASYFHRAPRGSQAQAQSYAPKAKPQVAGAGQNDKKHDVLEFGGAS